MGCGGSSAAAQEPQPSKIFPGQSAIIRNCPNAKLNGEWVICEQRNNLGEWTVKGDKFPLSVGMSMAEQYLEVESNEVQAKKIVPGQAAIIRNCPNAKLNGERVVCEEYNAGLDEWTVKGEKFPLSVGMSLGEQFLEPENNN